MVASRRQTTTTLDAPLANSYQHLLERTTDGPEFDDIARVDIASRALEPLPGDFRSKSGRICQGQDRNVVWLSLKNIKSEGHSVSVHHHRFHNCHLRQFGVFS